MIAYYHKCVTVCLTNQMSPFFMLCLCVVLGVFVPCDRSVLPVIAGFSCVFFLILFMVKAEVSVIVPRDWVCSLFVCLTVFVVMQPFVCFLCGCGHGFIQGCQQLCLFLLIAVGVFLAGVLEGVGGARLCREARCCLRLLRHRGGEAKPAQQCPPPGSRGRYSHSWWWWAPTTPSHHRCLSQAASVHPCARTDTPSLKQSQICRYSHTQPLSCKYSA